MRLALMSLVCVLGVARAASAEPVVLEVDGDRVIVDLGAADGVGEGSVLELLHEVTVKDPVTHETLKDVFPLGTMTVVRAGDEIAEARADAKLAKRIRVGDGVRLLSDQGSFVDPWVVEVARSKQPRKTTKATPEDPYEPDPGADPAIKRAAATRQVEDAARVRDVWRATLGRGLDQRIEIWDALLTDDPNNRYAAAIRGEMASLRAQQLALDAAIARPDTDRGHDRGRALSEIDGRAGSGVIAMLPVEHARSGAPIDLAFVVRAPGRLDRAWLYARTTGAEGYQRIELAADGDAYLRGTIPAILVTTPGVDWFVEIATVGDDPHAVIGSDAAPERIEVADVTEPPAAALGRSRVSASLDYVDFDGGLGDGYDQYRQAEIDFMVRFGKPVYAFRLGFGTLTGEGGPKDIIDDDPMACRANGGAGAFACKRVSFTYGYVEAEFRVKPTVALMIRPQVGKLVTSSLNDVGTGECLAGNLDEGCDVGKGFGVRARLRLGAETATNLVLGIGATSGVGTLLEAAITWAPKPTVPVVLSVHVTDMPVPEDFGVRIIGDVGWRKLSWVYPSLRLSYQARDVDHAGFSGGLGLNFDW